MKQGIEKENKEISKRRFIFIWIGCLIGSWSVTPYVYYLSPIPAAGFAKIFFLTTIQSGLIFAVACWLSYLVLPKTDLSPFAFDNFLKQILYPGLLLGALLGCIIFGLEKTLFHTSTFYTMHPPIWMGVLASIYGGINEEVLLRLFLFTSIYFLINKTFKRFRQHRFYMLWTTNIIVAVAFGIGHLPMATKAIQLSDLEIFRILFLNGISSLVLGALYGTKGLWAVVLAHFVADLIIHVLLV